MRYYVDQGVFKPPIELEIEQQPPPCMLCGDPVHNASMAGPLVCGRCDCGRGRDGNRKTSTEFEESRRHAKAYIERYRVRP